MSLESLVNLDRSITLAINGCHCPMSDSFWVFMSNRNVWIPLYAAFLALLFWRLGWKKAIVWMIYLVLCILCVDQFANLVKDSVCRLRPSHDPYMIEQGIRVLEGISQKHCYGFFSSHAGNSFAFATGSILAIRQDRRLRWNGYAVFITMWAVLLSLSRVFVGKHFMGDILVGTAVGITTALLLYLGARALSDRIKERK